MKITCYKLKAIRKSIIFRSIYVNLLFTQTYFSMKKLFLLSLAAFVLMTSSNIYAQFGEPEVREQPVPKNLFDEGYKSGFGFIFGANDFGFGLGGQYRKGINRYNEGLLTFKIAGIRDPREQTFIDFFGTKTTPDKFKRVISIPVTLGIKHRFLAREVSDNFRFYGTVNAGPVFAYTFPYFDDRNNNGFRENRSDLYRGNFERTNDIFTGWSDGEWELGLTGTAEIGFDFGSNFANLQSFQFGYNFYYFDQGLQILEPAQPRFDNSGQPIYQGNELQTEPNYKPKKYFGSAQLSFVFGWMWD